MTFICYMRLLMQIWRMVEWCTYDVSPASCNRTRSAVTFSSPSFSESSEREMWPSCEVGSSLSDIARCRSSKDSLMWSARRKYWLGFAIFAGIRGENGVLSSVVHWRQECLYGRGKHGNVHYADLLGWWLSDNSLNAKVGLGGLDLVRMYMCSWEWYSSFLNDF